MGETGDHLPKVNVFLWAFITMTKAWEGRFIWLSVLVLSGKFGEILSGSEAFQAFYITANFSYMVMSGFVNGAPKRQHGQLP